MKTITGGVQIEYKAGVCNKYTKKVPSANDLLTATYVTPMTTTLGLVADPFNPTSTQKLVLWRSDDSLYWVWLNSASNDVVYIQSYRSDMKRWLVFYFSRNFQGNDGVSDYNFFNYMCLPN